MSRGQPADFSERVRLALRAAKGRISQAALAKALQLSPQALNNIAWGRRSGRKHASHIAEILAVPAEWLVEGNGSPPPEVQALLQTEESSDRLCFENILKIAEQRWRKFLSGGGELLRKHMEALPESMREQIVKTDGRIRSLPWTYDETMILLSVCELPEDQHKSSFQRGYFQAKYLNFSGRSKILIRGEGLDQISQSDSMMTIDEFKTGLPHEVFDTIHTALCCARATIKGFGQDVTAIEIALKTIWIQQLRETPMSGRNADLFKKLRDDLGESAANDLLTEMAEDCRHE